MEFTTAFLALLATATPILALETEGIGSIEALFDGETIAQPTVLAREGDEAQATAFMFLGGAFANLNIVGYNSADNKRLSVEVDYMAEQPGPQTAPMGVTISYAPRGGAVRWTSDGAPSVPAVTFTTLEADGEEGRAVGTFAAELCYSEDYEDEGDPANCRSIEGRFDTRFFVER